MRQISGILFYFLLAALIQMCIPAAADQPAYNQAEPICLLQGSFPDPTIVRVGEDYYMTHSTAGRCVPSFLVWHSRNLLEWTPLTYAIPDSSEGFAPEITHANDKYYIYYDRVSVLTAKNPAGPWKNHGKIKKSFGIDPGHFVDYKGERHLYTHMGFYSKLSKDGLKITDKPIKVYSGWPIPEDWSIEDMHLESPKIFKKDKMYYLVSAQGGTFGPACGHMAVVSRSQNPEGPWEHSPYNPAIRTWDRNDPWWTTGHATFFEGPGGEWFAVYHGYRNGYRVLGRCTLMLPVKWTDDGWPVISEKWPEGYSADKVKINLPLSDEFDGDKLGLQWQFTGKGELSKYNIKKGSLILKTRETKIGDSLPLTVNARHIAYEIETEVELAGADSAGLIIMYKPYAFVSLGIREDGSIFRGFMAKDRRSIPKRGKHRCDEKKVRLKIVNDKSDVRCYYMKNGKWTIMQSSFDMEFMSDAGFYGNSSMRPGVYAVGGKAEFSYFRYKPYRNRNYEEHIESLKGK